MIDFERFRDWAERRLGDIVVSGAEIKANSIFAEDHKRHMWCNPNGGKKNNPNGVYHCWKTGEKGSLVGLVMQVEKCEYQEALEILGGQDISLHELEKKVNALFENEQPIVASQIETVELTLPPFTFPILELAENNYFRTQAEIYLQTRKIPVGNLHVCTQGEYKNRIVIPYYDRNGKLIYYNCRFLGDNKNIPKYLGPPKEVGIGKTDVLFFPTWPKKDEFAYMAEGEFDGLSICASNLCGGGFGGKEVNEKQIILLLETECMPVFCLDNDDPGIAALQKINEIRPDYGAYVRAPRQVKDWNELLVKYGPDILAEYIKKNVKNLTRDSLIKLKSELL